MFTKDAIAFATEFQESFNLDVNTTEAAICHDLMHAITGLGATLEDEEIVLNAVNVIICGECNPIHEQRVQSILAIASLSEFFPEIVNFLA